MGQWVAWTQPELDLFTKYFRSNWRELTLFQRIIALNPQRTYESMTRQLRRMKSSGWTKSKSDALNKLRIGYLDIESSNLNADFGYMLSWCIKTRGKNEILEACINKKEIFDGILDRRILEELLKALDQYDVLYTHWGADRRFDLPFIRTRAFRHGLERRLPVRGEKFIMDTWPIARNKLRLHSNRLDSIAQAVGIKNVKKTPLDASVWVPAALGDEKALNYVLTHNRHDVLILERVHKKLELIENATYRSM